MPDSKSIQVNTAPAYKVTIAPGLLAACGSHLRALMSPCHMAVVADSTVAPLYLDTVQKSLSGAGFTVSTCVFPAGEEHKNFSTLAMILEFLAERRLTRTDCVAALGGGVTGAVDSSVGGKTAIDLRGGKNLAGAFLQPAAVLCDTDCLATLPRDVFAGGAAEAIKTGVLCDESLFSLFEDGTLAAEPSEVIARCVAYKAGVVERDEREQGERRLLNLGHTVGHAIEACSGYAIPHGHAVAAGLAVIARAGEALGWTEEPIAARVAACLRQNGLPTGSDFSPEALAEAASADKKRSGGDITLVVPKRIGLCQLKKIPVRELLSVIRAGLEG